MTWWGEIYAKSATPRPPPARAGAEGSGARGRQARDLHSRWRRVGEWRVDRYHPESRTKEKRRTLYSPDSSGAF